MADLTSLYQKVPLRDKSIQACVDCIFLLSAQFPEHFVHRSFSDCFRTNGGSQPPKSKFVFEPSQGYVRFLQIRDFASESTPTYIPISNNNKLCTADEILLGRYGASIGKILTGKSGAYNVACAKVTPLEPSRIRKDYLFYWLHSSYFQNYVRGISRSAQGGFNSGDLGGLTFSYPANEVQETIVRILRTVDAYFLHNVPIDLDSFKGSPIEIELVKLIRQFLTFIKDVELLTQDLSHQIDAVSQLRNSFLREAIQGTLVRHEETDEPAEVLLKRIKAEKAKLIAEKKIRKVKPLPEIKHEEIPFEIPKTWAWCRLKDLGLFAGGGTPSKSKAKYWNGNIPWISPKDMKAESLGTSELKITKIAVAESTANLIPSGSLLIVGRSGILKRKLPVAISTNECTVNQDMKVIIPFLPIMSRFMQLMLFGLEGLILKEFVKYGMTVHSLKYQEFEEMAVPLPPLAEQKRIVEKLEKLMAFCDELEANIRQSKHHAETLLQVALKEALAPQ
ncbi:MAG TPA: restriction endonuclease subunit S [Pyrinomonadaceae bacterium]|nr:restriction endonuclease subunit S [Pyrinomonadaceae bacterium]